MTDTDIYLQWAVAGIVFAFLLFRGQVSLFHPSAVYLAFHTIVFCLRPTMVHFHDFDFAFRYMELAPRSAEMVRTLHVSSVALVLFVGAFTLFSRGSVPLLFGPKRELTSTDRKAFYVTALIFGPLGLYSVIAARPKGETINGVFVMTGTSGYLNDLQNVLIPVSILFILVSRWRWWSYLPFLAYIMYRMNMGWGRWTFLLSCFLLVLVWLWDHRRRFPPWWSIAAAPLLAVLFLKLSHDRAYLQSLLTGERSVNVERAEASRDWRDKWDTLDFANYDYLVYIVTHVPRNTRTHTYGAQYLQLFTEPIPRKLWKNKPVGAPVKFFDLNDYGDFNGLTPSIVGDGWMSGAWFGMSLTMLIIGGALGAAYRWFTHHQDVVHKACVFLIINAMIVQLFRDGGISIFKFLLFALVPLFAWHFLSTRFRMEEQVADERAALREARFQRMSGLPPAATEEEGDEKAWEDEPADDDELDEELDEHDPDDAEEERRR